MVGQREWGDGLTSVSLDDRPAYVDAVRRLAELGHRRIAHVEGPQEFRHAHRRRSAWEETLRELGLPEGPVLPGGFTAEGGARATRELLTLAEPPTAIVYGNDLAATAGLSVAQELGVAVPDRLSVVGYDDTPLTRYTHPPAVLGPRRRTRVGRGGGAGPGPGPGRRGGGTRRAAAGRVRPPRLDRPGTTSLTTGRRARERGQGCPARRRGRV
ncbi:substrate-binding domain-containing protein [Streptomyces tendae]